MKKLQAAIAALILAAALMAAFVFWRGSQTPDSDPVGPGSVRTSSSTVAAPRQRQDESGQDLPTTRGSPADPGPGGAAGGSTNARTPADLPRVAPAIGAVAPTSGREIPNWAKAPGLPDRTVAGRVVGADGPIPGARLRLSPGMLTHARELDQHAVAGRDGAFTFAAVAPTNWFLTVAAQNFAPRVLSVDLRTASPVVRPTLEAPDRLVIRLAPCRLFVRGTVRDSERGLVPTARVKITRLWDNGGTSVEARDGRYELCLPDIDGTEYVLVAEADGYGSVETSAAFNESRVIDFALEPQARVRGIAAQPTSGEAQAAVKITLRPAPPADPDRPPIGRTQPIRRETLTGDDGRFELAGLVPGRYSVGVASDDFIAKDKGRTIDLRPGDNEITVELAQKTERAGTRN